MRASFLVAFSAISFGFLSPSALAQCPEWSTDFPGAGFDGPVTATLTADLGNGPVMIVAGEFERAGGEVVENIAAWDGTSWSRLGTGLPRNPVDLVVYDSGNGPELYAGFDTLGIQVSSLRRLEGGTWVELDVEGFVEDLAVFNDGSGDQLIVAGLLLLPGDLLYIAAYDGTQFTSLGGGDFFTLVPSVLEVVDSGANQVLYAGGEFDEIGGVPVSNIAAWDGVQWTDVAGGVNGWVQSMEAHDDGTGPALYVTGPISEAGGVAVTNIARFRSGNWEALPEPSTGTMAVVDDAQGSSLYLVGSPLQRWNGVNFVDVGPALPCNIPWTLTSYDSGSGLELISQCGTSLSANSFALRAGAWDLLETQVLLAGGSVRYLETVEFEGDSEVWVQGPQYVGGQNLPVGSLARYDGTWDVLDTGFLEMEIEDAQVADLFGVEDLFVAGHIEGTGGSQGIAARFDGVNWTVFGDRQPGDDGGLSLAEFKGELYLGQRAMGITNPRVLLRWDGADWVPAGIGTGTFSSSNVRTMLVHDDGSGPALFCAGTFRAAGGQPVRNIARWDGSQWSDLDGGLEGANFTGTPVVTDLVSIEGANGPLLVASGRFQIAGGQPIAYLAAWDGQTWSALGSGLSGGDLIGVSDVAWHDSGEQGLQLYAVGDFTMAGGVAVGGLARFDGTQWHPVGDFDQGPIGMAVYEDDQGRGLFFGGGFQQVDGVTSSLFARLEDTCAPLLGLPFCNSSPNSSGSAALLRAEGAREVSQADVTLRASGLPAGTPTLAIYSSSPQDIPFDAGRLCLGIPIVRIQPPANSDALGRRDLTIDFNAPYAGAFVPGTSTYFQLWFRDPLGAGNSDLTDGLRIDWR